jgi:hypothetical protein
MTDGMQKTRTVSEETLITRKLAEALRLKKALDDSREAGKRETTRRAQREEKIAQDLAAVREELKAKGVTL